MSISARIGRAAGRPSMPVRMSSSSCLHEALSDHAGDRVAQRVAAPARHFRLSARCHSPGVMLPRKTAVAAFVVVVVAGGLGVAAQRAQDDTACDRYQAVVADVERAERGQGDMTFEEAQRTQTEALAACMQEQSNSGE